MTTPEKALLSSWWHGVIVLALGGFLLGVPCQAEKINEVDFEVVYRPTAFPEQSAPPWQQVGNIKKELMQVQGTPTLQMSSEVAGTGYFELAAEGGMWNPSFSESGSGLTVEFVLRVDRSENANGVVAIRLSDQEAFYLLQADEAGIWPYKRPKQRVPLPLGEAFQKIRIVVAPGAATADVYVNGAPDAVLHLPRQTNDKSGEEARSHIAWGDLGSNMGGQTSWQYFAFTSHGAFSPSKP